MTSIIYFFINDYDNNIYLCVLVLILLQHMYEIVVQYVVAINGGIYIKKKKKKTFMYFFLFVYKICVIGDAVAYEYIDEINGIHVYFSAM